MPARYLAAIFAIAGTPAFAGLIFNAGNGAIVMGVAPYGGAPNVGGPTYIANNVTGRNDILTSPGLGTLGGYLTASPVIANNIVSDGGALPLAQSQTGGGNASGAFGAGAGTNSGTDMAFALADSGPGGGSASYLISAADFTMMDVGAPIAAGSTFGAYLSIAGLVPLVGNADVASLRVHVSDTAGVFGAGGLDLPQLVLAISRNGAGPGIGNYNIITIGGAGGWECGADSGQRRDRRIPGFGRGQPSARGGDSGGRCPYHLDDGDGFQRSGVVRFHLAIQRDGPAEPDGSSGRAQSGRHSYAGSAGTG